MPSLRFTLLAMLLLGLWVCTANAQPPVDSLSREKTLSNDSLPFGLSAKYIDRVSKKVDIARSKLRRSSRKILHQMEKQEARLYAQARRVDSAKAAKLFSNAEKKYRSAVDVSDNLPASAEYLSYLDTLQTSFHFLRLDASGNTKIFSVPSPVEGVLSKIKSTQSELAAAERIKQVIKERRQYLKEQLSRLGMQKKLKKLDKPLFYYSQSIREHKELLKDKSRLEAKAVSILRKMPGFRKFFDNNSQLASIFGAPSTSNTPVTLSGVQTRAAIQQSIPPFNNTASGNSQPLLQQQLIQADQSFNSSTKSLKLPDLADNIGDDPSFKTNSQRSKPLLKRLVLGLNFQFGKVNRLLPSSSEIALSLGYKLNDEGVIGIASAYRIGLGENIRKIRFSSQGIGLRSFIDWKIKGSIYISGEFQWNHFPQLRDYQSTLPVEDWQRSGSIGVKKTYPAGRRKGYVQLLFDFLSYRQLPRSQPLIFRTGINF